MKFVLWMTVWKMILASVSGNQRKQIHSTLQMFTSCINSVHSHCRRSRICPRPSRPSWARAGWAAWCPGSAACRSWGGRGGRWRSGPRSCTWAPPWSPPWPLPWHRWVPGLLAGLDLVDDVVRDLAVLPHAQHVVALDGGGVPDQEHAALALRHQQVRGVLPRHRPEVPAAGEGALATLGTLATLGLWWSTGCSRHQTDIRRHRDHNFIQNLLTLCLRQYYSIIKSKLHIICHFSVLMH